MVAFLLAMAAVPRRAESKVMILAALNNPAVAASQSPSIGDASNAAVAAPESAQESSEHPKVRIDQSGIHVGGKNPVDIDVPALKHRNGEEAIDVVALAAVVLGCSVPIAIVAIIFYARHRRLKMHHETIRAMVEKGMPIPPEMVAGTRIDLQVGNANPRSARSDFRGGLILIGVGAGLIMIAGKVGWILVFIGAARLVFWLVEDRKQNP